MSLTSIVQSSVQWAYSHMEQPWVLLLIIPLILLVILIMRKEFVKVKDPADVRALKRKTRHVMIFTRIIIGALLLIAIASPFIQKEKTIEGDPYIKLLVDNSSSMALFKDVSAQLKENLEKHMNTEVSVIGLEEYSNIGDDILNNLEPHGSVLLLSDGNANAGADLGDVALYSTKLEASINAVALELANRDARVVILGPSKALADSENTFSVFIGKVGNIGPVHLTVTLDGETIYDQETPQQVVEIKRNLPQGTHQFTAKIEIDDYFSQNNEFYKTVRVVPKPKVLFVSEKDSPMQTLLKDLYVVDVSPSLPSNLEEYYAVFINDIPAETLDPVTDVLNDFVIDGNGLVVFGGESSFDKGGYKNSMFESLLPVFVGAPEKKEGETIIALVMDVSGSTGAPFGRFESTADFEKSASIGIIRGLKLDTRLAVIAFNTKAYLLSEPSRVFEKVNLEETLARLKFGGGTLITSGLMKAIQVIGEMSGGKNIILMSDGKSQGESAVLETAKLAANMGIKIYTVGVGPTTNEKLMMDIADITNGIYFRATQETKLQILFGPVDETEKEAHAMTLEVLNESHFITSNLKLNNSMIYGFNDVVPKGAARMLVTTSTAEPILNVWRVGLGRVAALATDDGAKWAGTLLGQNSRLITRTANWAIGDPERKSKSYVEVSDTHLNEPAEVFVKSETPPEAENVVFYKVDEETYTGSIQPTAQGFQSVAGTTFAVNYAREYDGLGFNPELEGIVTSTGGKVFAENDIAGIVEHAKSRAKRTTNSREHVRWPFIACAVALFLVEIFIRRIVRKE